jgi:hypothetical protein
MHFNITFSYADCFIVQRIDFSVHRRHILTVDASSIVIITTAYYSTTCDGKYVKIMNKTVYTELDPAIKW